MKVDAVVIMARCNYNAKSFEIRMEKQEEYKWVADWAFNISEGDAHKEGYNKRNIEGSFHIDEDNYPGCPHCEGLNIVQCGECGKIMCWDGKKTTMKCPWCKRKLSISEEAITDISAGSH